MKKLLIVSSLMLVGALAYGAAEGPVLRERGSLKEEGWQKLYLLEKGRYIEDQEVRDRVAGIIEKADDIETKLGVTRVIFKYDNLYDEVISYAIKVGERVFNPDNNKDHDKYLAAYKKFIDAKNVMEKELVQKARAALDEYTKISNDVQQV